MRYALAIVLLVAWPLAQVRSAELTFVEKVFGDAKEPLPLLIAIHGLGDTPERFSALFDELDVPVRLIAPRAPDAWSVGTSWFPIDDPARMPKLIAERAKMLVELVEQVKRTRAVRGLPIVTGFSQGGFMSYALAAYHSERFEAALPIAGMLPGGMPAFKKPRAGFRVISFHGKADKRVPYEADELTVARLKKAGADVTLIGYANIPHTISPTMQRDYVQALREVLFAN